jgi:hypothetical protein
MTISTKLTAITVASALALTGCVSNTADPNANRTRDGAILGGMLGGFLGAASSDDNQAPQRGLRRGGGRHRGWRDRRGARPAGAGPARVHGQ